ncbi:MAG: hypothetical protein DWQ01_15090 [Planctomycetota bacterium]|nr:MAG: hypothetical protein DWQ01_15090 [Planctomycetota bacterium]
MSNANNRIRVTALAFLVIAFASLGIVWKFGDSLGSSSKEEIDARQGDSLFNSDFASNSGKDTAGRRKVLLYPEKSNTIQVLNQATQFPLSGAIVRYLDKKNATWGTLITNENGEIRLPTSKETIVEITEPGHFGIQADLHYLPSSQGKHVFSLYPSASLSITLESEGESVQATGVTLVAIPLGGREESLERLVDLLANPQGGRLKQLRDHHQLSSFFANIEGANQEMVTQLLRQAPFSHLRDQSSWNDLFPEDLAAPAIPFPWVRQTNENGVALWLHLPGNQEFRWAAFPRSLADVITFEPPFEQQEVEGIEGGFRVQHGIPKHLSGVFTLMPGQLTSLKASMLGRNGIKGTLVPPAGGEWVLPAEVVLFHEDLQSTSTGQSLWSSSTEWRETVDRYGSFWAEEIRPGEKTLCAHWVDQTNRHWFASKAFHFDANELLDLGNVFVNGNASMELKIRFRDDSGVDYDPKDIFHLENHPSLHTLVKERGEFDRDARMYFYVDFPIEQQGLSFHGLRPGSYLLSSTTRNWRVKDEYSCHLVDDGTQKFQLDASERRVIEVRVLKKVRPQFQLDLKGEQPEKLLCQVFPASDHTQKTQDLYLIQQAESNLYTPDRRLSTGDFWFLVKPLKPGGWTGIARSSLTADQESVIRIPLDESVSIRGIVAGDDGLPPKRKLLFFGIKGVGPGDRSKGFQYSVPIGPGGTFELTGVLPNTTLILRQNPSQEIGVGFQSMEGVALTLN